MTDWPEMPESIAAETEPDEGGRSEARRALLVAEGAADEGLRARLAGAGFEVACADAAGAARSVSEFGPEVLLIAFGGREGEAALVTLARRLRGRPETLALPVVFLYGADSRTLRSAAEHFGADDYFSREAAPEELRARLEALRWRTSAGRRAAPLLADQRSEIDNFIFLLDAVGLDAGAGGRGSVALVEAAGETAEASSPLLAAAHGFLKLNLRRADALAFYGPQTLVAYLPRLEAEAAGDLLASLREEFLEGRAGVDLRAGVSSFPADGLEVEGLVEKAEAALNAARAANQPARVFVYHEAGPSPPPGSTDGAGEGPRESKSRAAAQRRAPASPAPAREAEQSQQGEERGRRAKTRQLMLIVSDAGRMAQVNLLLRSAGYEVRAAFDGQHALNLLRIDRPDLLLVDYELQGMDGVEMLRRLAKQSGARTPPPAVLLLPGGREELRGEARAAGARGLVQLPYDPVELLETLGGVRDLE